MCSSDLFVEVVEGTPDAALSPRTAVEDQKLRRRPQTWRLACQALVQQSLLVITRPQVNLQDRQTLLDAAWARPLPPGPTAWPAAADEEADAAAPAGGAAPAQGPGSATSDEDS